MAVVLQNRQRRLKIDRKEWLAWCEALCRAAELGPGEVTVRFVRGPAMRRLNERYRGTAADTDVLAFSFAQNTVEGTVQLPRGDVAISVDAALRQAPAYGHSTEEELRVLIAHGVAHLMGYEDGSTEEKRRMRDVERRLVQAANLATEGGP